MEKKVPCGAYFPLCVFTSTSRARSEAGAQLRRDKGHGKGSKEHQQKGIATDTAPAERLTAVATANAVAETPSCSAVAPTSKNDVPWYIPTSVATPQWQSRGWNITHISHGHEEPWAWQSTGWRR